MIIRNLKVNHIKNPIGYAIDRPVFSYITDECGGKYQKDARICIAKDPQMEQIVFDSGISEDIDSIAYKLPEYVALEDDTRYYWQVAVTADNGEKAVSDTAFFETAIDTKKLNAKFIACEKHLDVCTFFKSVHIKNDVSIKRARLYASALGIYEVEVNDVKVGNEYLAPYTNDYDSWLQFQTYDVTNMLSAGENKLEMTVAPGWYSGYFGFEGKNHIYGDETAAFLQMDVAYADGTKVHLVTDETWMARENQIRYSEIYHGEVIDRTYVPADVYSVKSAVYDQSKLEPRRSLPVIVKETVKPKRILHTPAGETVIDMGQNMVGWLAFKNKMPNGTKLYFQTGEVLQQGNFYRENLRAAKSEFTYISDGTEEIVRPHFTFYGFRYVKVEGYAGEPDIHDFVGEVIYSDMDVTGTVETSNPLVNRLFQNALWGQKGNFVDTPTDCPQRDERLGWTGDAQVFSGTAAFNMDVYAFYAKFGYDMLREQQKYNGNVPMVIPSFHMGPGGSSAWADAATVIPWTTYLHSGDKSILEQQYPSMKMWTDHIIRQDKENGDRGLWQVGFHFGDWLALDGNDPSIPTGATEQFYVASCYYYWSVTLTAKAAKVLGFEEDAGYYSGLSERIKRALQAEYFTANGRLAIPTQTGYILALAFGICPEGAEERVAADLNAKITKDGCKLMTGFVGTPYICKVLSEYGYNEMAYKLLLKPDCPGWLYPVRMGATTIWERWNSILPDGTINPEGMNSLNHYSYGSIAEWMYRYIGGIHPVENKPGFRHVQIKPMPDYRMSHGRVAYESPIGTYVSEWSVDGELLKYRFVIPFGGSASVTLPDADCASVICNGTSLQDAVAFDTNAAFALTAGTYEISYKPTVCYKRTYNVQMSLSDVFADVSVKAKVCELVPALAHIPLEPFGNKKIIELGFDALMPVSLEDVRQIDKLLNQIVIEPDQIPEMIMDI